MTPQPVLELRDGKWHRWRMEAGRWNRYLLTEYEPEVLASCPCGRCKELR